MVFIYKEVSSNLKNKIDLGNYAILGSWINM